MGFIRNMLVVILFCGASIGAEQVSFIGNFYHAITSMHIKYCKSFVKEKLLNIREKQNY